MGHKHKNCCEYEYYKKCGCGCNCCRNSGCNFFGLGNCGSSCNNGSIWPWILIALCCNRW
ncbi:hypothetical protein [Clostridium rectalis]|uniref:hypothetical protein n=1 Tax=Clostridium rectalis TaxID=2040295 RepID=UPI000F635E94|nr:hypothetical protein [Clostridium rectalis]